MKKDREQEKRIEAAKMILKTFGTYRKAGAAYGVSGAAIRFWITHGLPKKYVREAELKSEIDRLNATILQLKKRLSVFESIV